MTFEDWKRVVPAPLRRCARKGLRATGRIAHELQWQFMPKAWIERWGDRRLQLAGNAWLFVLGCNNSGTTLLSQVLASHPEVRNLPKEGQRLTKALPFPPDLGVGRLFTSRLDVFRWTETTKGVDIARLRYDWARHFSPGIGALLEKSPPNTVRGRWLQRHFSPARFLVFVRHPYAVCEGIRRRKRYPLTEAAHHWKRVHATMLEDMPFLKHVVTLKYEDLCQSPLRSLRSIEEFIGVRSWFDVEIVGKRFSVHNMDNEATQIQDFNAKSFASLSPEDVETINDICGTAMLEFGYEPLDPAMFARRLSQQTQPVEEICIE